MRRTHAVLLTTQETAESIWIGRQTSGSRESGAGFAACSLSKRKK